MEHQEVFNKPEELDIPQLWVVGMRRYGIWINPGSVDLRAWAILETLMTSENISKRGGPQIKQLISIFYCLTVRFIRITLITWLAMFIKIIKRIRTNRHFFVFIQVLRANYDKNSYLLLPPLVEILEHVTSDGSFDLAVDVVPRLTGSLLGWNALGIGVAEVAAVLVQQRRVQLVVYLKRGNFLSILEINSVVLFSLLYLKNLPIFRHTYLIKWQSKLIHLSIKQGWPSFFSRGPNFSKK